MIGKLNELLIMLQTKAYEHRKITKELEYADGDRLDDRKYHDGMADMANVIKIKILEIFRTELKPDDTIACIDDGIDLDNNPDD